MCLSTGQLNDNHPKMLYCSFFWCLQIRRKKSQYSRLCEQIKIFQEQINNILYEFSGVDSSFPIATKHCFWAIVYYKFRGHFILVHMQYLIMLHFLHTFVYFQISWLLFFRKLFFLNVLHKKCIVYFTLGFSLYNKCCYLKCSISFFGYIFEAINNIWQHKGIQIQ